MSNPLHDLRREALKKRLASLQEQYNAAYAELNYELSAANRVVIENRIEFLEQEIQKVESKLALVPDSELSVPPDKEKEVQPAPEELYGKGNRWAVLVGIDKYEDVFWGELDICVKDVEAIYEQLITIGFKQDHIHLLTDKTAKKPPTRENIVNALVATASATVSDDLLLFYYSGHGKEDKGKSYLAAQDSKSTNVRYTGVSVEDIRDIMEEAHARAKVIVLDACHAGADFGGKGPKGTRPMSPEFMRHVFEEAEGIAVLSSCKQGEESYPWPEMGLSVFTYFLLEALKGTADQHEKRNYVTVQDVYEQVLNGVRTWAFQNDRSQTPTLQSAVVGDIVLGYYQGKPESG